MIRPQLRPGGFVIVRRCQKREHPLAAGDSRRCRGIVALHLFGPNPRRTRNHEVVIVQARAVEHRPFKLRRIGRRKPGDTRGHAGAVLAAYTAVANVLNIRPGVGRNARPVKRCRNTGCNVTEFLWPILSGRSANAESRAIAERVVEFRQGKRGAGDAGDGRRGFPGARTSPKPKSNASNHAVCTQVRVTVMVLETAVADTLSVTVTRQVETFGEPSEAVADQLGFCALALLIETPLPETKAQAKDTYGGTPPDGVVLGDCVDVTTPEDAKPV